MTGAYQPVILPPPVFLARYYSRETWRCLPGPWPVKLAVLAGLGTIAFVCLLIPGPFDEMAVIGTPKAFRSVRELIRKVAGR